MTDVEKYGVFALVFVMGVLGLIVFYDPDTDPDVSAVGGQSVIIRSAADVRGTFACMIDEDPAHRLRGGGVEVAAAGPRDLAWARKL